MNFIVDVLAWTPRIQVASVVASALALMACAFCLGLVVGSALSAPTVVVVDDQEDEHGLRH